MLMQTHAHRDTHTNSCCFKRSPSPCLNTAPPPPTGQIKPRQRRSGGEQARRTNGLLLLSFFPCPTPGTDREAHQLSGLPGLHGHHFIFMCFHLLSREMEGAHISNTSPPPSPPGSPHPSPVHMQTGFPQSQPVLSVSVIPWLARQRSTDTLNTALIYCDTHPDTHCPT